MLSFDPSDAFCPEGGVVRNDVAALGALLERLRDEICEIDCRMLAGDIAIPAEKQPLHAGFFTLPESQLRAYEADRQGSELARILACTKRLMSEVDRVVVLGASNLTSGSRGLLDACCQPYFNELSRAARGSRPRIVFASDALDNDAMQGLLHLLDAHRGRAAQSVDESWGLVALSQDDNTTETAETLQLFLPALVANCGDDWDKVRRRLIPVTAAGSWLHDQSLELGCNEVFVIPDGVGSRYSVLSTVGLIPAALMGINVMQLLAGAAAMNEQFRTGKASENIVLQMAAVNHLAETKCAAPARVMCVWNAALESAGKWAEQILAGSLGKQSKGSLALTVVHPRELHVRNQQHLEGRRDKIIHNIVVEQPRFDPLVVGRRSQDIDPPQEFSQTMLPAMLGDALRRADQSLRAAGRMSTKIVMPQVDECSMGQLYQLLMLATVVEARLLGINPYS